MDPLTKGILLFQESGQGREKLLKTISLLVYAYPRRHTRWEDDMCSDFYLSYYPKIFRLIKHFRYQGLPFRGYLYRSLFWHVRTFASSHNSSLARNRASLWSSSIEREASPSNLDTCLPSYPSASTKVLLCLNSTGTISKRAMGRRVLYLLLINAFFLTDREIRLGAKMTDLSPEWLFEKIDSLKEIVEKRFEHLPILHKRRNRLYVQLLIYQQKLRDRVEDEEEKRSLVGEIKKITPKMTRVQEAIAHTRLTPSHKEIARVLEIPKGSVDSGIFYLKKHFSPLLE